MSAAPWLVGVTGTAAFCDAVAGRTRWLRPERLRGIGLVYRAVARRAAAVRRPWRRVFRIEPHIHVRLSRHDVHHGFRAVRSGPTPPALSPRQASADRPLAKLGPLVRALVRHPAIEPASGPHGVEAVLRAERRRVERRWTTVSRRSVERSLFRVCQRAERIDAVTPSGVARPAARPAEGSRARSRASAAPGFVSTATPVRRVLHRPSPEVAEIAPTPMPGSAPRTNAASSRGDPAEVELREAGVNVERLTDRVVRAIDRRLIAHRERMGRS